MPVLLSNARAQADIRAATVVAIRSLSRQVKSRADKSGKACHKVESGNLIRHLTMLFCKKWCISSYFQHR